MKVKKIPIQNYEYELYFEDQNEFDSMIIYLKENGLNYSTTSGVGYNTKGHITIVVDFDVYIQLPKTL